MTKTNYCSNCGRKIDPQVAYCQYCEEIRVSNYPRTINQAKNNTTLDNNNNSLNSLKVISKLGAPLEKGEWSLFIVGLLLVIFGYVFFFLDMINLFFKSTIFITLGFLFLYTSINLKWRGVFLLILVCVTILIFSDYIVQLFKISFRLYFLLTPQFLLLILLFIIIACGIRLILQPTQQLSIIGGLLAFILFLIDSYFMCFILYFLL